MRIIVDLGGTKGDWCFILRDGRMESYVTRGFNPVLQSMWDLEQIIKSELPHLTEPVEVMHYYGAGVHGETIYNSLYTTLKHLMHTDEVEIHNDLMAACRATCQHESGIVSILGTGSASCLFNGTDIEDKIPSLGFIAGDEGAGSRIGKRVLQAYFYREMPTDIQAEYEENYPLGREEILENIYKRPGANSYLASFANFALTQRRHPFMENIISEEFDRFVVRHLLKYNNARQLKCHFVGSIAWFAQDILKASLERHNLTLGSVIRKPIDDLVRYHSHS
ncbi:MAG: hypothetical protein KDC31_03050 [Saprospiraceae bacterium]|nr:hypothetical protein [Saprospiraceae bacterium]MBX7180261.1 hypothetical protein [Saprospiraceae bacterium]MCB0590243.1 hypothetical protein [Saprospiraceae bacterium]MCO5282083.1 hypothetical protein [Saprospiraceae bacterium]MCO6470985.1 hypothetical protein [Saprospiraceae bacterium]